MENSIKIKNKNECCGCNACVQKCPKNAIRLVEDKEGFFYPLVDEKKCIDCGLCKKVCPFINFSEEPKEKYPKTYAIKNKNKEEVKKSSSGGMFILLAKEIIKNNGIIYGAAYDEENNINHIGVEKKEDLIKLQGSKYVQSNINNAYKEVKKNLDKKRLVLFTGTPCQIKGLKNFLVKDYENLLTCDLVCHGVPSQKLFQKYLSYLENKYHKKIKKYDFRNKEKKGWGLTAKITFEDNSVKYLNSDFDSYYSNFLDCNTYRESCYNCKFANINRSSDITLADYWGILSIHNKFYDEQGVSLVLINTEKGERILSKVKDKIDLINTDLDYAISKNKNLKEPSQRPEKREKIYNQIDMIPTTKFIKEKLNYKVTMKKIVKIFIPNKIKKHLMKFKGMKK